MRMTVSAKVVGLLAALLLAAQAQADTRGVYSTPDGEFTIEYRDDDHIRFSLPEDGFLLITEGEAYALHRDGGQWFAISGKQIREMAQAEASGDQVRVTALGQQETVAGITGERYRVEVGDEWADEWRDDGEVVLSDDPRVRDMGRAMERMAELFGNVNDQAGFGDVIGIDPGQYGVLRADEMELTAISTERLRDRNFQLPPNVQQRELPAAARRPDVGGEPQRGTGRDRDGERQPGWLGRQMQGTGEDARDEAAGETRREVRDNVREGVRGLFR